jgi:hypothetical protein
MRESAAAKHSVDHEKASTASDVVRSFIRSVDNGKKSDRPYTNWLIAKCFPDEVVDEILALPFEAPSLDGLSGKRELHNNTRKYFDVENRKRYPVVKAVAEAFQDKRVTNHIETMFGTNLDGTYLRIEFAQDIDGFWLEPHTDLGVKVFTMLLYLSKDPSHADLGTDIYDINKKQVARSAFVSNSAMVFVPSNNTYHGFERRPIKGVRTSLIINYVTNEWLAREQLSFPEAPIA